MLEIRLNRASLCEKKRVEREREREREKEKGTLFTLHGSKYNNMPDMMVYIYCITFAIK